MFDEAGRKGQFRELFIELIRPLVTTMTCEVSWKNSRIRWC